MVYAVMITQTTGKTIEEVQFSDLEDARELYEQLIETTSYQRVLVLLLEKPDPWQESILDVHYVEGITYTSPITTFHASRTDPDSGKTGPSADCSPETVSGPATQQPGSVSDTDAGPIYSHVLVVDDIASLYLHRTLLEDLRVASYIETASDGLTALNYVASHCHWKDKKVTCPDLILLDLSMPIMDGFEFLDSCRKLSCMSEKPVKVILVTSSNNETDKKMASNFDIAGYLVKPINKTKLLALI